MSKIEPFCLGLWLLASNLGAKNSICFKLAKGRYKGICRFVSFF